MHDGAGGPCWMSEARACDKRPFRDLQETVSLKLILNTEEPQGQNHGSRQERASKGSEVGGVSAPSAACARGWAWACAPRRATRVCACELWACARVTAQNTGRARAMTPVGHRGQDVGVPRSGARHVPSRRGNRPLVRSEGARTRVPERVRGQGRGVDTALRWRARTVPRRSDPLGPLAASSARLVTNAAFETRSSGGTAAFPRGRLGDVRPGRGQKHGARVSAWRDAAVRGVEPGRGRRRQTRPVPPAG